MARLVAVLILYSLLGLLGQVQADSSVSPSHSRIELTIPVHVFTNATKIAFDTPRNQTQLTGLLQEAFSVTSNVSALQIGTIPLNASYEIFGELFVPDNWKENGTGVLEFAVHGLNLDRTYWSIDGSASPLNYVESSLKAGHAIFVFDRLGSGQSSKPDGIKEVQTAVHIPVIDSVISFLRNGVQGFSFKTIVGIGHSYGSFLLAALAANVPDALDAIVLTGFTVDTQSVGTVNAGLGLMIASQANHTAFAALDFMTEHRGIITIGEFLTRGQALSKTASNYVGPVLVVTGDKDLVECGGNCFQSLNGSANLLEPARAFFPNASDFQTFIPAQTGHCLHAHFSAPESYSVIHDWIARHSL